MPSLFRRLFPLLLASLALAGSAVSAPRYAVQDLTTGDVIRRGEQVTTGIARGQLILAPNSFFRVWVFDPASRRLGFRDFKTPAAGRTFSLDEIPLFASASADRDGDGLSDEAEMVLGTNPNNSDTDGDGVSDGAALDLGLDPVTGAFTGIIGGIGAPGVAVDIAARNDLAVLANSGAGITVFNIFNAMPPVLMASVDTPGNAQAVAISGNHVAVADGPAGLAIVNVADPPAATITRQVSFGITAIAVAASNGVAYVALAGGDVAVVALESGQVLQRGFVGGNLQDLAVAGDALYALTTTTLRALPLAGPLFSVGGSATAPGTADARRRLHAGTERAYASHNSGYNVFTLSDPAQPSHLSDVRPGTAPWRQIKPNGSGMGVAAHSTVRPVEMVEMDTHLYALTPDALGDTFLTSFEGGSRQVRALTLYNGQAYLASGPAGLEVLNYLAVDSNGVPPTVALETTAVDGATEEGQPFRVTAVVGDDVQVRNVEFYVDGARVAIDGNATFEHRFNAPRDDGGDASFLLQARASDTGGNATWSDELVIELGPDVTGPIVLTSVPGGNTITGQTDAVSVLFSEPIDPASFDASVVLLVSAGVDQAPNTSDDEVLDAATARLSADGTRATLTFSSALDPGIYFFDIGSGLRDLAGNRATPPGGPPPTFRLVAGEDPDRDGVPSDFEAALGLDPLDPDSDDDGLADGFEDNDGDGLGNAIEIVLGLDPGLPDTDGNGVPDFDEDADRDSISNGSELAQGMNPLRLDSDADGFWDELELTLGSNPIDLRSQPSLAALAPAPPRVIRPAPTELPAGAAVGTVIAQQNITAVRPSATELPADIELGTVIAPEDVTVVRPSESELPPGAEIGTVIAKPETDVTRPTSP